MAKITIIGTGSIGSAVATLAAKGGSEVQILGRNETKVAEVAKEVGASTGTIGDAITGDIVVLAVPYSALADLAGQYSGQLDGKTLVDVSNPLDFETFELVVPADSSATEELQALVPGASVVKAFNTNFAATLVTGQMGNGIPTVLVAGDDDTAKQALIEVITAGGVQAVSAGPLKRARELEGLGLLALGLASQEVIGWTGGFAVEK